MLKNKKALVTGSSRGIGRKIVELSLQTVRKSGDFVPVRLMHAGNWKRLPQKKELHFTKSAPTARMRLPFPKL